MWLFRNAERACAQARARLKLGLIVMLEQLHTLAQARHMH